MIAATNTGVVPMGSVRLYGSTMAKLMLISWCSMSWAGTGIW
jgi:hypothetical protein